MSDQDQNAPLEETQVEEQAAVSNEPAPEVDLLSMITREDGSQKYASVPDALKALNVSQTFIQKLEDENKSLKDRLSSVEQQAAKNIAMEDILNQLSKSQKTQTEQASEQPSANAVSQDELVRVVTQIVQNNEMEKISQTNQQQVDRVLTEHFGDKQKAAEHCKAKAAQLGLGPEWIKELASRSPKAFLDLMGIQEKGKTTSGGVNINPALNTEANVTPAQKEKPKVSVMSGASSSQLKDAWQRTRESVEKSQG